MIKRLLQTTLLGGVALGAWRLYVVSQKVAYQPADAYTTRPDAVERLLGFASVGNLRDIGGYITANGRTVLAQRLYRGASLAYLTETELARFAALGVSCVFDLRTADEIARAPDQLPDAVRYWHLPMLQVGNRWLELGRMLLVPRHLDKLTTLIYIRMLDGQRDNLAQFYRYLLDAARLPVMVHCSAGKDRTGVVVALLLLLLGVPENIVLADYSLTNDAYDYIQTLSTDLIASLKRLGFRDDDITPLLIADPQNLKRALAHLTQHYGGIEAYFRTGLGFSDADIAQLRANFLTPVA